MRVVDSSVLKLVRMWLNAPVVEEDPKTGKKRPLNLPASRRAAPPGKARRKGGVISPLLANIFLHWLDQFFHMPQGPRQWANARLVRYADDFVVMARYQGASVNGGLKLTHFGRFKIDPPLGREITVVDSCGDACQVLFFEPVGIEAYVDDG